MKSSASLLVVLVGLAVVLVVGGDHVDNEVDSDLMNRRPLGRCVSGHECGPNQCSVMGMQRFSEPQCAGLRGEGATCIVGAQSENKTLDFPDKTLECSDVYLLYCPCQLGLTCRRARCVREGGRANGEGPRRVPRLFPQWAQSARVR